MEIAESVAHATGAYAPQLTECRAAWAEAQAEIGSGADQAELPRWLETLTVPKPDEQA
jgi:hypothetical protein